MYCHLKEPSALKYKILPASYSSIMRSLFGRIWLFPFLIVLTSFPISEEFRYLRNDMIPGLLKAASYNLNRKKNYMKIFEIGNIQIPNKNKYNLCNEEKHLSVMWVGLKKEHWKTIQNLKLKYFIKELIQKTGIMKKG